MPSASPFSTQNSSVCLVLVLDRTFLKSCVKMLKNILVTFFLVLCILLDLNAAQNCNKEIQISKVQKVNVSYVTKERYKDKCPFAPSRSCPFWRNVTKQKTEDKVVESTLTILACCPGYYLVNDTCYPYCEDPCINGFCTASGICSCFDGYAKSANKDHVCNPVCSICVHGDCVAPDTCQCHEGFVKDPFSSLCVPYCGDDCGFGTCKTPFRCECDLGYEKDENETCTIKTCPVECKGGTCNDGVCECPIGSEWNAEKSSCSCSVPSTTPSPFTILADDSTTEMTLNLNDDYQNNLIWILVVLIIFLSSFTLFLISAIIWLQRRYTYRHGDTSLEYQIRFST